MWQDIRFELRTLLKSPVIVLVAALTLGLGIGANTTVFSLIKAMILDPLPGVQSPRDLVVVSSRTKAGAFLPMSYPNYVDLRDKNTVFTSLAASAVGSLNVSDGGEGRKTLCEWVSSNYFDTLGTRTSLGRPILASDNAAEGASPVVVISDALWHSRFHGDPGIVGHKIELNGHPFEIVGVAEPHFLGSVVGIASQMYIPLAMQAETYPYEAGSTDLFTLRDTQWLMVQGRLKPGITVAAAQSAMTVLGDQLLRSYPNEQIAERAELFPLWKAPFGAQFYLRPAVSLLSVVGVLVLLAACANVANVLLAMATGRRGELAVRMALGAERGRLIRQLLTGSLLLGLFGGIFGFFGAALTGRFLANDPVPMAIPTALNTHVDMKIFLFSLLLATLVGVIAGLSPAARVSAVSLTSTLRQDAGAQTSRRNWIGSGVLIAEVTVSLVLMVIAALTIHSVLLLRQLSPGFDATHILVAGLDLKGGNYNAATGTQMVNQLIERLDGIPGVVSASVGWQMPVSGPASPSAGIGIEGYTSHDQEDMIFHYNVVGPDYLRTLNIPMISGREFSARDDDKGPMVMIVNESMASRFWPGQNAIGHRVSIGGTDREIVGIASEYKHTSLVEAPEPYMYVPLAQSYQPQLVIHVRGSGPANDLRQPAQRLVSEIAPGLELSKMQVLDEHVKDSLFGLNAIAVMLVGAACIGLVLTGLGIYGVASQSVMQRLPEIGIRSALGATPRDILWLVVSKGLTLALVGVLFGLFLSFGATRFVQNTFEGVNNPLDPVAWGGASFAMVAVVLSACWIAANKATKLHPANIFRTQ